MFEKGMFIARVIGDAMEPLIHITRPPVSTKRLSLTRNGQVCYELKTPWSNGTTHVIFEPLDFMSRMDGMPRAQGCAGDGMDLSLLKDP